MSAAQRLTSREHYEDLLDKYDTWLFDCDGVLWHGTRLVEGALEVLQFLRSRSQSMIMVLTVLIAESPLLATHSTTDRQLWIVKYSSC